MTTVAATVSITNANLEVRKQARDDGRAWEKKAIDRLVKSAGLDNAWYTIFSPRHYNGKTVWCWNFTVGTTPGKGHHHVVFDDGEAIMFKGETDVVVARIPAPECAPDSGIGRNEPSHDPSIKTPWHGTSATRSPPWRKSEGRFGSWPYR